MIKCEICQHHIKSEDVIRTITANGKIKATCIDKKKCERQKAMVERRVYCDVCHTWQNPNEITWYTRMNFPVQYWDNRMGDYASCKDRSGCKKRRTEDPELRVRDIPENN